MEECEGQDELIKSYYDVMQLYNKYGRVLYSIYVSPTVYEMVESSDCFDDKFFMSNGELEGYQFVEIPHGSVPCQK